ncbi:hypothetical protein VTK56DRAFT_7056 [Thermocarpiscus australiensis]
MASDVNADEIEVFLSQYRDTDNEYAQLPNFDHGYDPRWAPPVTNSDLLDDANYPHVDAQSEYTTTSRATSRAYTAKSAAPSSIFSSLRSRDDGRSSVGQSSAPSVGFAGPTFEQQFVAGPAALQGADRSELWCEFSELKSCPARFRLDDEAGWIQHHIRHLRDRFPQQLMCWFCDHVRFIAEHPAEGFATFELRMQHIRGHILDDHRLSSEVMRPDFYVVEHLYQRGMLSESMYRHAMSFDETPEAYRLPGSYTYSSSSPSPWPLGQPSAPREKGECYDLEKENRAQRRRQRERKYGHGGRRV